MALPATLRFASPATSDVLDFLSLACRAVRNDGADALWPFLSDWSDGDRLAWDAFLLRMDDPLAAVAGSPESRFRTRVTRMVANLGPVKVPS